MLSSLGQGGTSWQHRSIAYDAAKSAEKNAACRRPRCALIAAASISWSPRRNFHPATALTAFSKHDSAIRVRNRFLTERAGLARFGAWEDRNEQPMVDWFTTF